MQDTLSLKLIAVGVSSLVGAWLLVGVWRSKDPLVLKIALTGIAAIPVLGPIIVYWTSNFPSRLHPDSQARYPKRVNSYGLWRTESDPPSRFKRRRWRKNQSE